MKESTMTGEHICELKETQKRWSKIMSRSGILYLYGMSGFGKTSQALSFARNQYREWVRLCAGDEDFLREAALWLSGHKKQRSKTLLIMDDLQWLLAPQDRQTLFDLLLQSRKVRGLHIILISRAAMPAWLTPLWLIQQIASDDQDSLRLHKAEIKELLISISDPGALSAEQQYQLIESCEQLTGGYALAVNAYLRRCVQTPGDLETAKIIATHDVWGYFDKHLLGEWPAYRVSAAVRLSVYPEFTRDMAAELLGDQTDCILQDFLEAGSFLTFTAPDAFSFTPFFCLYLSKKLRELPEQERIQLYETAARGYEKKRYLEQALRCYKLAERTEKIAELVVYLCENADGCSFARIAQPYVEELSPEQENKDPRLLGAKAMFFAYRMQTEECTAHLERLKQAAENERKLVMRGDAMKAYVRAMIACPYGTADAFKDNLLNFAEYFARSGFKLQHIMPTGNLPSLISGGLDLLPWEKHKTALYPVIKAAAEAVIGKEAVGIADGAMGEILYEQNQKSKAMAHLTKALVAADLNGTIRVQYAVTAIMARMFQSENQSETAESILKNMAEKAKQQNYSELLPNIEASIALCTLLKNDDAAYRNWLEKSAPDEHADFYITSRFQLLVKAKVYTALGRELEALYILGLLEEYAVLYKRTYLHIEILTLKAVLLYQRGEAWQESLRSALDMACPYGLVRIFADQGAALLPLLNALDREEADSGSIALIIKECKTMAASYPDYLGKPRRFGAITDKEMAVLKLMARGLNNTQISAELGISLGTVKFHAKNIMLKLNVSNRTLAVKVARDEELI